jgi:hypothetical protein
MSRELRAKPFLKVEAFTSTPHSNTYEGVLHSFEKGSDVYQQVQSKIQDRCCAIELHPPGDSFK